MLKYAAVIELQGMNGTRESTKTTIEDYHEFLTFNFYLGTFDRRNNAFVTICRSCSSWDSPLIAWHS